MGALSEVVSANRNSRAYAEVAMPPLRSAASQRHDVHESKSSHPSPKRRPKTLRPDPESSPEAGFTPGAFGLHALPNEPVARAVDDLDEIADGGAASNACGRRDVDATTAGAADVLPRRYVGYGKTTSGAKGLCRRIGGLRLLFARLSSC